MADRETFKRWLADRLFRISSWCEDKAENLLYPIPSKPSPMDDRARMWVEQEIAKSKLLRATLDAIMHHDRPMPKASGDVVHIRRPVIFEEKP